MRIHLLVTIAITNEEVATCHGEPFNHVQSKLCFCSHAEENSVAYLHVIRRRIIVQS